MFRSGRRCSSWATTGSSRYSMRGEGPREAALRPRLRPGVHAAWTQDELILLDLKTNRYFGLNRQASCTLASLLDPSSNPAAPPQTTQLNEASGRALLRQLVALDLILLELGSSAGDSVAIPSAEEQGGLSVIEWLPDQCMHAGLQTRVRYRLVAEAFATMLRIDLLLLRKGLGGLIAKIAKTGVNRNMSTNLLRNARPQEIVQAVERARLLYPRRVDCLTLSGALASMLLKRGIDVHLVVGVQKYPFYAHCWVEANGKALNDSRDVSGRLAILLRIP